MQLTPEKLIERAEKGFSELDSNRKLFEDCDEYILPYRNTWGKDTKSINRATKQFDSTALIAASNFINTMQRDFFPPFTRWLDVKAGPAIDKKLHSRINKVLEEENEKVFEYVNASNFSTAIAEMCWDWGKGTGCLWLFEGDDQQPLNFIASPISQMALVEGKNGSVGGRFRKWKVKGRLVKETWKDVDLTQDIESQIRANPDTEMEFIEGCYWSEEGKCWFYDVVHVASKHRIHTKKFDEEICFTPRWLKIPGLSYGVGPFVLALLDIKTLNRVKELMLISAAMNIFGVYTVAGGGTFNPNVTTLNPATFIPVERNGGPNGPSIAALPRSGDFQTQEYIIQDLKESIKKVMLDNKLPAETPQPKTAFEIAQRIKEFQTDIGSAYGRAMFELVIPLYKRILAILIRRGKIRLPQEIILDDFYLQVQVTSPVAQAQAMEDVQRLMNNINLVAGVGGPQLVLARYEIEKLPEWLAEKTGPQALLRDEVEADQIQKMLAGMMAQMQQAQVQKGA